MLIFLTACQSRPVIIYPEIGIKPKIYEPIWEPFKMAYLDEERVLFSLGDDSVIIPVKIAEGLTTDLLNRIAYTGLLQLDIDYYVEMILAMREDEG